MVKENENNVDPLVMLVASVNKARKYFFHVWFRDFRKDCFVSQFMLNDFFFTMKNFTFFIKTLFFFKKTN